jgi:hypothetical protein
MPAAPIDAVNIKLSAPAALTEKAAGITIRDSSGSPVDFDFEVTGSTAVLMPSSQFNANESYIVTVPEGAFQSESGAVNDEIIFNFVTESKVKLNSCSFTVNPSANWIANQAATLKRMIWQANLSSMDIQ